MAEEAKNANVKRLPIPEKYASIKDCLGQAAQFDDVTEIVVLGNLEDGGFMLLSSGGPGVYMSDAEIFWLLARVKRYLLNRRDVAYERYSDV